MIAGIAFDEPKKKIQQRLNIKLGKKDTAFLIVKDTCYYLHHLTSLYEPFVIVVKRDD